jgi:hypothetical protein
VPEGGNFEKDTEIPETYFKSGLFKQGITYHITAIRRDGKLYFHVLGDGHDRLFSWDLVGRPPLDEERVGLRQMQGRKSRIANFKIFELKR